jgi:hypothetical protein
VVRAGINRWFLGFMSEDGSGISIRNMSKDRTELLLVQVKASQPAGWLAVSFSEPDMRALEGPLDGQEVRLTLRRIPPPPKKDYLHRSRGFHWVQDYPFNR